MSASGGDVYRLGRLEDRVAFWEEQLSGLRSLAEDSVGDSEYRGLADRVAQLEVQLAALGEVVGRLGDRATATGAGDDLVSRAEVLRLIEAHGWSVRA